jgi:hypothetical protein
MPTLQDRETTPPMTEGSLALASDRLGLPQESKAKDQLALVKNVIHDPQVEALTEPRMLMTVIAMTLGLCMLWFLVIFSLYHLARFALYRPTFT